MVELFGINQATKVLTTPMVALTTETFREVAMAAKNPTKRSQPRENRIISNGTRFGRWAVIGACNEPRKLECVCDCGTIRNVRVDRLRVGGSLSCGCLRDEIIAKHGITRASSDFDAKGTYYVWSAMKERCANPNNPRYKDYGGRGITFCERWASFKQFLADMGVRPASTTLERKDNNRGYSPDNCKWADRVEQQNNMRSNRRLSLNGRTLTLSQWSLEAGIDKHLLSCRLRRGWTVERALFQPVKHKNR